MKASMQGDKGQNLIKNSGFEVGTRDWSYRVHQSPPVEDISFSVDDDISWQGNHSLRVQCNGANVVVGHRQLYLRGGRYAFSCYMKADKPEQKIALELSNRMGGANKIEAVKEFKLKTSWQRFSLKIDVPESLVRWKKTYFSPAVKMMPPALAGTLWLDGVMLQQGGLTGYHPFQKIIAGIKTTNETNVFEKGEDVELLLALFNPFAKEKSVQVSYKITDFYGKTVKKDRLKISVKGRAAAETVIRPDTGRTGNFLVHLHLSSSNAPVEENPRTASFAIIDPVDIYKVPKNSPFGAHCGTFGKYWELGEKVGIKWIRGGFYFNTLANALADGQYNERIIEIARRRGRAVLSVSVGFPGLSEYDAISGIGHNKAWKRHAKKYEEGWRKFAAKYKGRVDAYEPWNEPYVNADLIAKLHEGANRAIKSVDPDAPVVANLDHLQSLRRFLMAGGHRFCDCISLHPYRFPYYRGPVESNLKGEIHIVNEVIKSYAGRPMPVWITELGWSGFGDDEKEDLDMYRGGVPEWVTRGYHTERELANYVVQSYVLALSEGVKEGYFYHSFGCSDLTSPLPYDLLRPDRSPRASLVAFGVMVKVLSASTFVREVLAAPPCFAYLFESDTDAIICYWRAGTERKKGKIILKQAPREIHIIDIMGNSETVKEMRGGIEVPFDDTPRYAVVVKSNIERLANAFRRCQFAGVEKKSQPSLKPKVDVLPVSFRAKPVFGIDPASGFPLEIISERDGGEMTIVPAGEFVMGQGRAEGGSGDEEPKHKVYLSVYYMDKYEVTNGQFERFVRATGYKAQGNWMLDAGPGREKHPVSRVSWKDAVTYAKWAGKRLPTEAEWEKAARGTDGRIFPWGNAWNWKGFDGTVQFHKEVNNDRGDTTPVGSYPLGVSPYGCYDMAGNLWEWCSDWYGGDYYKRAPLKNPQGPPKGIERVARGGDWYFFPDSMRCAARFGIRGDDRVTIVGFRCAMDAENFGPYLRRNS